MRAQHSAMRLDRPVNGWIGPAWTPSMSANVGLLSVASRWGETVDPARSRESVPHSTVLDASHPAGPSLAATTPYRGTGSGGEHASRPARGCFTDRRVL